MDAPRSLACGILITLAVLNFNTSTFVSQSLSSQNFVRKPSLRIRRPLLPRRVRSRSHVAGIDLGTSNCAIAVLENGTSKVLPDNSGRSVLESVVCVKSTKDGVETLVGKDAPTDCPVIIRSVKSFLGGNSDVMRNEAQKQGLDITPIANGEVEFVTPFGANISATTVASSLVESLLKRAKSININVTKAVLTLPAKTSSKQGEMTVAVGKASGIQNIALLQEPIAAAFAHGSDWLADEHHMILIVDIGAGTTDVSILESWSGIIEILETDGIKVGGRDLDESLANLIKTKLKSTNSPCMNELMLIAEEAKKQLTDKQLVEIKVGEDIVTISREEFEESISDHVTAIEDLIIQLSSEVGLTVPGRIEGPMKLSRLVMVGGSSYVPRLITLAKDLTQTDPDVSLKPMEVVARGASVYAGILDKQFTGSIELNDGSFLPHLHAQGSAQGFPY